MSVERRAAYWIAGIVVALALLYVLRNILLPFVLGFAIAYFLDPAADFLERRRVPRWLAATVLTILFLAAFAAFLVLLAPLLQAQLLKLAARLPEYAEMLRAQANEILMQIEMRMSPDEMAKLKDAVGSVAGTSVAWLGRLLSGLWSGGLALFNLLSLVFITPVVAFYLLRDWDRIVARVDGLLPRESAEILRAQFREIDRTLAGFARGQAMVCLLLGTFYGVGLTIVGLEFGLIVGLATGLISFVPYFGMLIGLVLSVGLAAAQFSEPGPIIAVVAIFVVGQVLEGNVVTPKLVGGRVGLHPVWLIFALLAGGALFGFVGVLLSVPAAAVIGVLVRFALERYRASGFYGQGE